MIYLQFVYRTKPRELLYFRKAPSTIWLPTLAQAEMRLRFTQAVKESKLYSVEDVARLVGGRVVEVNGRKAVETPDGRLLLKHMAYVKYRMSGYRSERRRIQTVPAWLKEISLKHSIPLRAVRERALAPARF